MPVAITFAILSMSVSPVTMDPAASVWRVRDFASMPRTCAVLQAAYTAAIGRHAPAFPRDVRPSGHTLGPVTDLVPDARAGLMLSADDVADLATRQEFYRADSFRPVCAWHGRAGPTTDDEEHAIIVTFTGPVFSTADGSRWWRCHSARPVPSVTVCCVRLDCRAGRGKRAAYGAGSTNRAAGRVYRQRGGSARDVLSRPALQQRPKHATF